MNLSQIILVVTILVIGITGCGGVSSDSISTPTATQPARSTGTETPVPTATQPASATPQHSTTTTPSPTSTATMTAAVTPMVVTQTPMPTSTATTQLATATPAPTVTATVGCEVALKGGFLAIWQNNPQLRATLGCPSSGHPRIEPAAWEIGTSYQPFENGAMIWISADGWYEQPLIFVLYNDGTYRRFEDTFDPSVESASSDESPPQGLYAPQLGFGKLWRENADVRDALGWATAPETAGVGRIQFFGAGPSHRMLWVEQTDTTYVFLADGSVQTFDVSY